MKTILALTAAATALVLAPATQASPQTDICFVLKVDDTPPTFLWLMEDLYDHEGYSSEAAGSLVADAVLNYCPQHLRALRRAIDTYS